MNMCTRHCCFEADVRINRPKTICAFILCSLCALSHFLPSTRISWENVSIPSSWFASSLGQSSLSYVCKSWLPLRIWEIFWLFYKAILFLLVVIGMIWNLLQMEVVPPGGQNWNQWSLFFAYFVAGEITQVIKKQYPESVVPLEMFVLLFWK